MSDVSFENDLYPSTNPQFSSNSYNCHLLLGNIENCKSVDLAAKILTMKAQAQFRSKYIS